jgi:hypothetical protein
MTRNLGTLKQNNKATITVKAKRTSDGVQVLSRTKVILHPQQVAIKLPSSWDCGPNHRQQVFGKVYKLEGKKLYAWDAKVRGVLPNGSTKLYPMVVSWTNGEAYLSILLPKDVLAWILNVKVVQGWKVTVRRGSCVGPVTKRTPRAPVVTTYLN